jgi:hypothetical protein
VNITLFGVSLLEWIAITFISSDQGECWCHFVGRVVEP